METIMTRWSARLVGLGITGLLWSNQLFAQVPCDAGLKSPARNVYAYGPRGDRCEGIYVKQVGGTVLTMSSLTSTFARYDVNAVRSLRFQWAAPSDSSVRIRVRGIQPNLYYGMDALRPPQSRLWDWRALLLSPLKIAQPDIGALAWTRRRVGSAWRNVYLPLQISDTSAESPHPEYVLVVFPGVKLREVYLTLAAADSMGGPVKERTVRDHEPQNQGFYPAERPIRIKLPALTQPGLYLLQVSATLTNGSPVGTEPILIDIP